jgi:hypothetical protein
MSPVAQVPVISLVSTVLRHAVLYSNTYTRPVWAEAVQERPGSRDPQSHFGLLLQMEGLRADLPPHATDLGVCWRGGGRSEVPGD